MPTTSELEAALEAQFVRRVRSAGGYTIKLAPLVAGIPDRLVFWPGGRMDLVELKTDTGRLSAIQEHWHEKLRARWGTEVVVVAGASGQKDYVRSCLGAYVAKVG